MHKVTQIISEAGIDPQGPDCGLEIALPLEEAGETALYRLGGGRVGDVSGHFVTLESAEATNTIRVTSGTP